MTSPREDARPLRIAIACGGTLGHVSPALAVADACRKLHPRAEILFLGGNLGPEARLVEQRGYRFEPLPASAFFGVPLRQRPRALVNAWRGARRARRVLRRSGAELLLGFGGYGSVGAALAAASLRIPILLHELNTNPGLTNWLLALLARRVLAGWEGTTVGGRAAHCVGIPVSGEILAAGEGGKPPPAGALRVLVSGGTEGSRFLDEHVPDLLARLARRGVAVEVRHSVGAGSPDALRAAYAARGIAARITPFIEDMPEAYAWADVAVACGGAATLAELAAAGLPCVLVPLASAALDHQTANVHAFAARTGARWTPEAEWDADQLASELRVLACSPEAWRAAAAGMRRARRPGAAAEVVRACEALLSP